MVRWCGSHMRQAGRGMCAGLEQLLCCQQGSSGMAWQPGTRLSSRLCIVSVPGSSGATSGGG